jgi:acetate kinase
MNILVVNTGSRTMKLRLIDETDAVVTGCDIDPWDGDSDLDAIEGFLANVDRVDAIGHRMVHGGADLVEAVVLDDNVSAAIAKLTPLAPLHQPRALAALSVVNAMLPSVPAVACFDTGYHATLPPAASTYALPLAWRQRWPIRRYGFHGLSHGYAARRAGEMVGRPLDDLGIVTCHLGAGASLCATDHGRSVDTTMGFTPLEGLVMATRSGTVDPGLICWLVEYAGLTMHDVATTLEHDAGLAGLTGGSGDMREVIDARERDDDARLAFDVYIHRLRREFGGMVAALDRLDIVVFTGGVGEHQPLVRQHAAHGLKNFGVVLDADANGRAASDADISREGAPVRTLVVTAREDLEIASQVRQLLGGSGS